MATLLVACCYAYHIIMSWLAYSLMFYAVCFIPLISLYDSLIMLSSLMVGVCFLWQLVIIIAYAAEHSLNNRTVTIKRSAMFKQRSAIALQLSVVDVIVLFLCLVQHLS